MRLLALDTATEQMAVALADDEGDHAADPQAALSVNAEGGAAASAHLLPIVLDLLSRRGLRPADLQAIAFGRGPGAFTGVRTAVSVTQGLAFGIGCPVLSIDSLLIVAEDARRQAALPAGSPFEVWVAMDARMDEVYAASYVHDGQRWRGVQAPALLDLASLNARWQAVPVAEVAGTALAAFGDRLAPGAARRWPQVADRATALLHLARAAWRAGEGLPAEQAMPVYLRDKVALTTAEREALRQDKAGAGS